MRVRTELLLVILGVALVCYQSCDGNTEPVSQPGEGLSGTPASSGLDLIGIADPGFSPPPRPSDNIDPAIDPRIPGPNFPDNPVPANAQLETISQGLQFSEGPVYIRATNSLIFSDIPPSVIYQINLNNNQRSVFRQNSSRSNGNILDNNGFLITTEGFNRRRIVRTNLTDNSTSVLATEYNQMRLNAPNDIAVFTDNSIYFTDPTYGTPNGQLELNSRAVFRINPAGALTMVADNFTQPNGIAFSPDFTRLYVSDSQEDLIRIFQVDQQGNLDAGRTFYDPKVLLGNNNGTGGTDGITVDTAGNVYTSGRQAVTIINPEGQVVSMISVGQGTSNVTFGGPENKTLFITARSTVRKILLLIPGAR